MTNPIDLHNTLENLEAEYYLGTLAEVQNLPREIERLRADRKLREEMGLPCRY